MVERTETEKYDFQKIEARWRDVWRERGFFRADTKDAGRKFYYLNMFPYPSGYLHVGHGRNYIIGDVVTRFSLLRGRNTLNPMGWDAFGLPAENAAIDRGIHPGEWTLRNIAYAKEQFRAWGIEYDWDREVKTCDPSYYRWTQWLFLELYKNGLAYKKKATVNYCPSCKTVLANEQVVGGGCDRCGSPPEPKTLEQWFFRITAYADRLLDDLAALTGWPENVRKMQENWIGRSVGAEVTFRTETGDDFVVFTTRPDTLWGATFMVLAPEHPLVERLTAPAQRAEVEAYRAAAARATEIDRASTEREKTGVFTGAYAVNPVNRERIPIWIADYVLMAYGTGAIMAVPAHDDRDFAFALKFGLPILPVIERPDGVARSLVLPGSVREGFQALLEKEGLSFTEGPVDNHGGALVVTLDRKDVDRYLALVRANLKARSWCEVVGARFAFAFPDAILDLSSASAEREILRRCQALDPALRDVRSVMEFLSRREVYRDLLFHIDWGTMVASGPLTGTPGKRAFDATAAWLEKEGTGKKAITFRLHDWLISRQRYWGAPIPIVYCERCGTVPVPEKDLPVLLPEVSFIGKMGLADIPGYADTTCPSCGGAAKRDTDTMDTFVDSSWYYLRYINPKDPRHAFVRGDVDRWLPVDQYVGGVEHAILHLLYSRFVTKALHDLGHVGFQEPFARLFTQGMICHPAYRCSKHGWVRPDEVADGDTCPKCGASLDVSSLKMSKSKLNTVDPSEIIARYGADAERVYTLFMGPPDRDIDWSEEGIRGAFRFLKRVWSLIVGHVDRLGPIGAAVSAEELDEAGRAVWHRYHQTVKRVTDDLGERFSFNTAVAAIMELVNDLVPYADRDDAHPGLLRVATDGLVLLLAPLAPFVAEELWQTVGHADTVLDQTWPTFDPAALAEESVEIPVQVNGKVRARLVVPIGVARDAERLCAAALASPEVTEKLAGKAVVKAIAVPEKMVSLVVR